MFSLFPLKGENIKNLCDFQPTEGRVNTNTHFKNLQQNANKALLAIRIIMLRF